MPVDDPNSKLAPGENRLRTCQKCHVYAVSNFASFDPHADYKDAARYPKLHAIYGWIQYSVNILFVCFLFHACLWFIRALVDRLQDGGHTTLVSDEYALPRFDPFDRATFATLIVAFVGLTATGLAMKYSDQEWGQWLAQILGGFRSARNWHHFFAVAAILAFVTHVARAVSQAVKLREGRTWTTIIWGPDSLVPNGRDLRELGKMLLWFVGFGRKPGFERWAYWEKLDYWAFCLAALVIGISGLMLWYPNLFCVVLPGTTLNVAKMIHSEFAIYIASFLFLIHFFHAHFRPEKFPMDLSVMTGMVSEQHLRKYRPDYVARLEKEGKLSQLRSHGAIPAKPVAESRGRNPGNHFGFRPIGSHGAGQPGRIERFARCESVNRLPRHVIARSGPMHPSAAPRPCRCWTIQAPTGNARVTLC